MRIEFTSKMQKVTFDKLYIGDVFVSLGIEPDTNQVYIKIESTHSYDDGICNVVNLKTGELDYFDFDCEVIPVSATLQITGGMTK